MQEEKLEEISIPVCCKNKIDDASSLIEELPMTEISLLPKEPSTPTFLRFQSGFLQSTWKK